ncbi:MAG: hypothetical protein KF816_16740 [Melioribacteraceae bacterium]|nr:hypothetical protein [Melioribacteraceae bacterium]
MYIIKTRLISTTIERLLLLLLIILFIIPTSMVHSQNIARMKMGKMWIGVTDNGSSGSNFAAPSFFPNDYDLTIMRGQYRQANVGAGFSIATRYFFNSFETDPLRQNDTIAVFDLIDQTYFPNGRKVEVPMTSFVRYPYTAQNIVGSKNTYDVYDAKTRLDPTKFSGGTYDHIVEVTNRYIYDITVKRKIMAWGQNYNDNYMIYDFEFTNQHKDSTYKDVYILMTSNMINTIFSDGRNPAPSNNEAFNPSLTWQHYHGGRPADTLLTFAGGKVPGKLRVFYEYSADDPNRPGDQMGAPAINQGGRLTGNKMHFVSILHASKNAYANSAEDVDDFLQPRITYIGNDTKMPYSPSEDEFGGNGGSTFWAIRGEFSKLYPIKGNAFPNTLHGLNNDELGVADFSQYPSGISQGNQSLMHIVFGPYKELKPGQKIRIVYASGFAGISLEKANEVGKKALRKTLKEEPQNMPNPVTGWLPTNFVFPTNDEYEIRKNRWLSSGIDSVMLSAYRAKWNFDNNYKIPQAPPPPIDLKVAAYPDGTELTWSCPDAEKMPNFAGYRIMRKVSNVDTVYYEPVYDSDANDKAAVHFYKDKSLVPQASYYYYVQSKARINQNDLTADPTTRGKIIYSSRLLVPNIYYVSPPFKPQDDLTRVRIVPNPYNINDPLVNDASAYGSSNGRLLFFVNLPTECTIKIFTENGDLIKTIDHNKVTNDGSEKWDLITDSQQVISSGVYIAVFQKPSGEHSYQKFIIVR